MTTVMRALPPAIVFDWDNTLIDTFPLLFEASNLVRKRLGYPLWSDVEARAHIRLAGKDAFPALYGDRAREAESIFYGHVRAHHLKGIVVMDGARDLLDWISGQGIPLGILSNKRGDILRAEVAHLGWTDRFQVIYGPDDVGDIGKPDPRGLQSALAAMKVKNIDISAVWYVGDTENDIRTAQRAGVVSVYIENHRMSDALEIAALDPNFSFKCPRDCLDYLGALVNSSRQEK